jgi:hypothetical protein
MTLTHHGQLESGDILKVLTQTLLRPAHQSPMNAELHT